MGDGDIAEHAVMLFYQRFVGVTSTYPSAARQRCVDDTLLTLRFARGAAKLGSAPVLIDYLAWWRDLFSNLGLSAQDFEPSVRCLVDAVSDVADDTDLGAQLADALQACLDGAISLACVHNPLPGRAARYLSALLAADQEVAWRVSSGCSRWGNAHCDRLSGRYRPGNARGRASVARARDLRCARALCVGLYPDEYVPSLSAHLFGQGKRADAPCRLRRR